MTQAAGPLAIQMAAQDTVAVMLHDGAAGSVVTIRVPGGERDLRLAEAVPRYHKVSLVDGSPGDFVLRNATVIGELTAPVASGGCVHIHNLESLRARGMAPTAGDTG